MAVTLYGSGQVVVQVQSTTLTTTFTSTSTTYTDITGLSVTITPKSANNKILIFADVFGSSTNICLLQMVRGSTAISLGTSASTFLGSFAENITNSSAGFSVAHNFLDSPATTSAVTYKLQALTDAGTFAINKRQVDTNYGLTSTITVMEIAYA